MIKIFIFSLPFLSFSLMNMGGKDLLLPFVTTGMLIFYFFIRKNDAKIFFPKEAMFFAIFISYVIVNLAAHYNIKGLTQLLTLLLYFFFFLLLINIFIMLNKSRLILSINYFILICVVLSIYSASQSFLPVGSVVFKLFRNANASFAVWVPTIEAHRVGWFGLHRIAGLAAEPALWAGFLAVPLCLLLPRLYYKFDHRSFYYFLGILPGFLLTFGRTGFLAVFLAIIAFPSFVLSGNIGKLYKLFTIIIISFIIFLALFADISLLGGRDWSKIDRTNGMIIAFRMFIANPLFGAGFGVFKDRSHEYLLEGMRFGGGGATEYPFNYYLGLAAETGIVGLILWASFLRSLWEKISYQTHKLKNNTEERILYMGLGLAFLSIIFSWINNGGINYMYIFFVFALISALPVSIKKSFRDNGV